MLKSLFSFALLLALASPAASQSITAELAAGDSAYRVMRAASALEHYERALAMDPQHFEALWKASRSALDIARGPVPSDERRMQLFSSAERYARRARELRPTDAEGYFALARALGVATQSLGVRQKVKYATDIRSNALECVRLSPGHSGCHHILGVWNAEVMRLSPVERVVARNFLGGRALGAASWQNAQRHLEQATALAPGRVVHHLELGDVYRSRGNVAAARRAYQTALRLPVSDYNDERYKAQAEAALRTLP